MINNETSSIESMINQALIEMIQPELQRATTGMLKDILSILPCDRKNVVRFPAVVPKDQKLELIRFIRALTGLDLHSAKAVVEGTQLLVLNHQDYDILYTGCQMASITFDLLYPVIPV